MTRDRRLLLLFMLLMAYGLFVVEGRYRQHEEPAADLRHRHRHRHESSPSRRNHHETAERRSAWSRERDYEDELANDREEQSEEEDDEDADYEPRSHYDRAYSRASRTDHRARAFEPRYPARYHRGAYHGGGWYDEESEDGHRGASRYSGRNHRSRPDRDYRKADYPRSRDAPGYDYDPDEEELDYERAYGYKDNGSVEKHRAWWRSSRRSGRPSSRRDWRGRVSESGHHRPGRRYHGEDLEGSKRLDDWRRRSNSTEYKLPFAKNDRRKNEEVEDYEYRLDGLEDGERDEDEEDNWKDNEGEDDDEEELDNDFYRSESKAPLKTYDDIIRRLTSNDPTTTRSTVKRDYRNIENEKYTKRDGYGNFRYEPRNLSRPHDRTKLASPASVGATSNYYPSKRPAENPKSSAPSNDRKPPKDAIGVVVKGSDRPEKKAAMKTEEARAKTKSLEQDYDEYQNAPDEKEEDLIKAGVEEDSGMQADVTNTDYTEDELADEGETPATLTTSTTSTARPSSSSTTTSSTTTSTTTTTTTTSTARPVVTQHYDYRDPRAYESGTGPQYNGYQSKNDYPPMSAHSVHKWQSLGTRESVKETRGNMQQFNKNGKSAEIREALQHAFKVSREGSCQWPRPRVIPVRDVYPSPSTTYIPHCAILHRCSDDTGCCRSEALTCVPKHTNRVELSFYTTHVGGSSVVEKLSFYNHTECECRERTEYETANEKSSEQRVYRHYQSSPQPQNMRRAPPRKPCRCPSEFTPRITPDGECQCNCFENHQNCIKTRRGKGYFSLADRICIQKEECATPSCEFGEYMRRQGKCPKKKDKFDAIANYRTNLNHRYRS